MLPIITISREYGSGGHEIGKQLAKELNLPFYDKEIIQLTVNSSNYSEDYLRENEEQIPIVFPILNNNHSSFYPAIDTDPVFHSIAKVLRQIAEKPCVVVGRCADYVLQTKKPFAVFIYASMESKIKRKRELLQKSNPALTYEEVRKQIKTINKQRAKYYNFYTDQQWGDPHNFDLCLNTTNISIKEAVSTLAHILKQKYLF